MNFYEQNKKILATFVLAFFLNLSFFIGMNCLNILPAYIKALGANNFYTGLFMNFKSFTLVFYVVFLGGLLGNTSRKRVLGSSYAVFFISLIGMTVFHTHLHALFIFMVLSSIYFAVGFTMHIAIIHDIIPDSKRTGLIAVFGISGIISNPISAVISEYFYKNMDPVYLFTPSMFFCVITFLILFIIPSDSAGSTAKSKDNFNFYQVVKTPGIIPIAVAALAFGGGYGAFYTFLPNLTEEVLGEVNISSFFSAFSLIAVVLRLSSAYFIDRIAKKPLIIFGLISMLSSLLLAYNLQQFWMLFLIGILYGIGHAILFPSLSSAFVSLAPKNEKHNFSDAYLCIHTLGTLFLATAAGSIGDLFNQVEPIFMFMALVVAISVVYLVITCKITDNGC